ATRLALYRSEKDWAVVIEVFGYSPRAGLPDNHIHTFASRLLDRDPPERYVNRQAHENYLANNPHNESRFVYPIEEGSWLDEDSLMQVAEDATEVQVRGQAIAIPTTAEEYASLGVDL